MISCNMQHQLISDNAEIIEKAVKKDDQLGPFSEEKVVPT